MQKPILIYCYDAYCGWCYGFSPVIKKIAEKFSNKVDVEVLSGGMAIGANALPIEKIASYIKQSYIRVEDYTGIKFGEDFLWHINNPDKSDWVMNSEKPAIALSIFKEILPEEQVNFASDLQYGLNYEGRDLDDDEAYRHLLEKYGIPIDTFYTKLKNEEYKEKAYYEFALCKQLQVDSYPQVLLQKNENKFFLVAKGYTPYEQVQASLQNILAEI
jgi:putative protein-disulfide isomerase